MSFSSSETANKDYEQFNPESYFDEFYRAAEGEYAENTFPLFPEAIRMMNNFPKKVECVLDIGTGPIMYPSIVIRHLTDRIFVSDYGYPNRESIRKWVMRESLPYNFDYISSIVKKTEKSNESVEEMQDITRRKIQAIFDVDLFCDNIIRGVHWKREESLTIPEKFPIVMSHFCLTNVCQTQEGFDEAVRRTVHLIEDDGYLILAGYLNFSQFSLDGVTYKKVGHRLEEILETLEENGMTTTGDDFYLKKLVFQPENYQELETEIFLISKKKTIK